MRIWRRSALSCLRRKTGRLNHPDFSVLLPFSKSARENAVQQTLEGILENPYTYGLPEEQATLSVDQIRGLQRRFAYGAFQGAWRTVVILHADKMRAESANALLKTLEEPPPRALIVLVTSRPEALLPTIVSRCQFLRFPPVGPEEIAAELIENGTQEREAASVARSSGGNFRRAFEMAGGNLALSQDSAFRFLEALLWGGEEQTYAALELLVADRSAVFEMLTQAEIWLRDALLFQAELPDRLTLKE
ncbi:MAG: hypothetical protein O3B73_10555 [bacterium]|nr:hypothetical protein [bacterium]